ncbi:uncharacterized protein [Amphiura filiformis]|uniref:uncharacterized protein n=1 Tax=Amphiura filiformis TaxID=82378 RepID=UPI003B21C638
MPQGLNSRVLKKYMKIKKDLMALQGIHKLSDVRFELTIQYTDIGSKERRQIKDTSSRQITELSPQPPIVSAPVSSPAPTSPSTAGSSSGMRNDLFVLRDAEAKDISNTDVRYMLTDLVKKSEKRGKALFGKDEMKARWWPADLPWALKGDPREEKAKCWTDELKKALVACYKFYGCEDLLSESLLALLQQSDQHVQPPQASQPSENSAQLPDQSQQGLPAQPSQSSVNQLLDIGIHQEASQPNEDSAQLPDQSQQGLPAQPSQSSVNQPLYHTIDQDALLDIGIHQGLMNSTAHGSSDPVLIALQISGIRPDVEDADSMDLS